LPIHVRDAGKAKQRIRLYESGKQIDVRQTNRRKTLDPKRRNRWPGDLLSALVAKGVNNNVGLIAGRSGIVQKSATQGYSRRIREFRAILSLESPLKREIGNHKSHEKKNTKLREIKPHV
jgi:hypothetical protein